MAIPTIYEPMQPISISKAIWGKWTRIYRYESNISCNVDIYQSLFNIPLYFYLF